LLQFRKFFFIYIFIRTSAEEKITHSRQTDKRTDTETDKEYTVTEYSQNSHWT